LDCLKGPKTRSKDDLFWGNHFITVRKRGTSFLVIDSKEATVTLIDEPGSYDLSKLMVVNVFNLVETSPPTEVVVIL
jgi:hypothetical protein